MKSGRAKAEDATELGEVLLSTHAALGLTPQHHTKPSIMALGEV